MPKRILVVEDNEVLRRVMTAQLNALGVNSYAVTTGEEAIELAEFFDLVLMDINLPGMSGIDAARFIRMREAMKRSPQVPIVATTAMDCRDECFEAGMNDFCLKPVRRLRLQELIVKWVQNYPQKLRLLG